MARILCGFELLEHVLAGQRQTLPLALAGDLGRSQLWFCWARSRPGFGLLFLD